MEQVIANGLYLGAQYALIALGLTLIFGLMNVLNFAHGQMYVLGGFITYTIYGQLGLPFPLAVLCSGVTLAIIGGFIERYLFRTVIKRSHREESTMLLAAATAFFFDAVALLVFGEKQRGEPVAVHRAVGFLFFDVNQSVRLRVQCRTLPIFHPGWRSQICTDRESPPRQPLNQDRHEQSKQDEPDNGQRYRIGVGEPYSARYSPDSRKG